MIVCPQCLGSGKTDVANLPLSPGGINAGLTFTDKTQTPEVPCNYCNGNKFFAGSST